MLPEPISSALFDIRYKITDVVLDYICNAVEQFGYSIINVEDNDLAITIKFSCKSTNGELRVDRLAKEFELTVKSSGFVYVPIRGDWGIIIEFLRELNNARRLS